MKIRTIAITAISLVTLAGVSVGVTAQTVYKTVDENGNPVFTDKPPMNQPVEAVDGVSIDYTNRGQMQADKEEAEEQEAADETAQEIRDSQDAEEAAYQAAVKEQNEKQCAAANARLDKYKGARRLYRETPDGEREYLNDAELDAERAKAARAVTDLCG